MYLNRKRLFVMVRHHRNFGRWLDEKGLSDSRMPLFGRRDFRGCYQLLGRHCLKMHSGFYRNMSRHKSMSRSRRVVCNAVRRRSGVFRRGLLGRKSVFDDNGFRRTVLRRGGRDIAGD